MSTIIETKQAPVFGRVSARNATAFITSLIAIILSFVPLVGFTTKAARACACGCSVFDVGGLDLPQEQEHGGRVFFEFWSANQTQNYVGSSRAPASINLDKQLNTQWYNVGFSYNFNRDWGVMVRIPTANRALTTDTGAFAGVTTFNPKDLADIEIMGMYTGFFKDMSTGIIFGVKLPDRYPSPPPDFDRDNQIGTGSTDLCSAPFIADCSAATMPGSIFLKLCGDSRSSISPLRTLRVSSTATLASCNRTFRARRSMPRRASFTTTCTTCSASTRSRRSGR